MLFNKTFFFKIVLSILLLNFVNFDVKYTVYKNYTDKTRFSFKKLYIR